MTAPLAIAIIGRPNVGKSTLFNRLTHSRAAIVHNQPGVTRDRKERVAELYDVPFRFIDTAGLEDKPEGELETLMLAQTKAAIAEADVILFVYDARAGVTPQDAYFAKMVRQAGKKTLLLANKCEGKVAHADLAEAFRLGLGEPMAVSAEHGIGMGYVEETLLTYVPEVAAVEAAAEVASSEEEAAPEGAQLARMEIALPEGDDDLIPLDEEELSLPIQMAIVGRPNAGKSTLFNQLVGEERVIVSPIAGTTRDTVMVDWHWQGQDFQLVDTAGLRKAAKRRPDQLEGLSADETYRAIQYAQVVIMLMDANQALDKQDLQIAAHVLEEGRVLIPVLNKWDLVKDKNAVRDEMQHKLGYSLAQVKQLPLVTVSALNGKGVAKVMQEVQVAYTQWNRRISTGQLNRWLEKAQEANIPPLVNGRRIRLKYATQIKMRPPTFALFTSSNIKALPDSYMRYLKNSLCEAFDFQGIPLRLSLRKEKNPYHTKS